MASPDVLRDIVKIVNAQRAAFEDVPSGTGLNDSGQILFNSAKALNKDLTVEEFRASFTEPVEVAALFNDPSGTTKRTFREPATFTVEQAQLLIIDIAGNVLEEIEGSGGRIAHTSINLITAAVEAALFKDWTIDPQGNVIRAPGPEPFKGVDFGIEGRPLDLVLSELESRSDEFEFSPNTLTKEEKKTELLEQMSDRRFITDAQKSFLENPDRDISSQEVAELGVTQDRDDDAVALLEELRVFSEEISGTAIAEKRNFTSFAGDKLVAEFSKDPLDETRTVHSFGFSPRVERQRQEAEIANRVFSDPRVSPEKAAEAYLTALSKLDPDSKVNFKTNTIVDDDPDEQRRMRSAAQFANSEARGQGLAEDIRLARLEGKTPAEIGLIVNAKDQAILEQYNVDYSAQYDRELGNDQRAATEDPSGINKTLARLDADPKHPFRLPETDEAKRLASDAIFGRSVEDAEQILREIAPRIRAADQQFLREQEREGFNESKAKKAVSEFFVGLGFDLREIPESLFNRHVSDALREGGLTNALKQGIVANLEGDVRAALEEEGFAQAQGDLPRFIESVAAETGAIQPFGDDPFSVRFEQNVAPQIANEIAKLGLESTEEIRAFVEQELTPGESTIGLLPFEVSRQDFVRQTGGGDLLRQAQLFAAGAIKDDPFEATDRLLGIRPPEPLPSVEESEFLPLALEAAGDDPLLLRAFRDEIPRLEEEFRTTQTPGAPNIPREALESFDVPALLGKGEDFASQLDLLRRQLGSEAATRLNVDPNIEIRTGVFPGSTGDPERIATLKKAIRDVENRQRIAAAGPAAIGQAVARAQRPTPPTRFEFFEGQRPDILKRFEETPTGLANIQAREREEVDERRRTLRRRGRTTFSRGRR